MFLCLPSSGNPFQLKEETSYHLLELATMTPLSMEKLSRGRPAMFHAWILIGSPNVLIREYSPDIGNFFSYTQPNQLHFSLHKHRNKYTGRHTQTDKQTYTYTQADIHRHTSRQTRTDLYTILSSKSFYESITFSLKNFCSNVPFGFLNNE